MSLNIGPLRLSPNGDIYITNIPVYTGPIHFNGGTPVDDTGGLVIAPEAAGYTPDFFIGGLGYTEEGAIVTDGFNPIIGHTNSGLPYTSVGLAVSPNAPTSWAPGGIPLAPNGRVSVIDEVPPPLVSGFSDGFSLGFGATV